MLLGKLHVSKDIIRNCRVQNFETALSCCQDKIIPTGTMQSIKVCNTMEWKFIKKNTYYVTWREETLTDERRKRQHKQI